MILFPAIDIYNGRCVRLLYGDFNKVTDYGDPVEKAHRWADEGAQYLHIVDLNGAKTGEQTNLSVIREISKNVNIPLQTGGGIRTLRDIELRLKSGIKRVILGSVCCFSPALVYEAVRLFGSERIVCGIDVKDNRVAVKGWVETADIEPVEFGKQMVDKGIEYAVYTDITRDGALKGVNASACANLAEKTSLKVIASGGVTDITDIEALLSLNMYGAILGKALYDNRLSLKDALKKTGSKV